MQLFICLTFLVLLSTAITTVKGPADKIVITAPDGRPLALTDHSITASLSMVALEVFPQSIPRTGR